MKKVLLIIFIGLTTDVSCQESEFVISRIMEEITYYVDESVDLESLNETLVNLNNHPIDLNRADYSDLQSIPFLSETEILQIINYRDKYGQFLSRYELFLIGDLDSSKVELFLPFVRIVHHTDNRDSLPLIWKDWSEGYDSHKGSHASVPGQPIQSVHERG